MFTLPQTVALLVIWIVHMMLNEFMIFLPYGANVLLGWLTGLVLGEPATGLAIGGTMELMGIGMNPLGGSAVPDYATGTFIGVAFAIGTGQGMDVGIAFGIPVATLCVQLVVIIRMIDSIFLHKAMEANQKHNFKGMENWIKAGLLPKLIIGTLPILLILTAGSGVVEGIVAALPAWLMNGFSVAGGVLPAVGFAILLNCLPLKNNFMWVILGYVLFAYLNMPVLGIALLAVVIAWVTYLNSERPQQAAVAGMNGGIQDDE